MDIRSHCYDQQNIIGSMDACPLHKIVIGLAKLPEGCLSESSLNELYRDVCEACGKRVSLTIDGTRRQYSD